MRQFCDLLCQTTVTMIFLGEVQRFLPFNPKTVFFMPQKSFVTDGTLRQQVRVYPSLKQVYACSFVCAVRFIKSPGNFRPKHNFVKSYFAH